MPTGDVTIFSRSSGRNLLLVGICFTVLSILTAIGEPQAESAVFTREELKSYFAIQLKLYPKNGDQFRKLIQTFGDHPTYTSYQVTAITDPKKKMPVEYHPEEIERKETPLVDSFQADEARRQLAEYEKTHPEVKKQLTYTLTPQG